MTAYSCPCGNLTRSDFFTIPTYKRVWYFCKQCGSAFPDQRVTYPLAFLPLSAWKPIPRNESSMYDYFVSEDHIRYSEASEQEFFERYIIPLRIDINNKHVLDISGGNGHFLKKFLERGNSTGMLTEINEPSLAHAKESLGLPTALFNFNEHKLDEIVAEKFDLIMPRAAIMFCANLLQFCQGMHSVLNESGVVVVNHSVIPTLGVMLRVQFDEFSYAILRQPETVIKTFEEAGFALTARMDETDPSMYVYDNDFKKAWRLPHTYYEFKAINQLGRYDAFSLRARDRRRSTLVFTKQ